MTFTTELRAEHDHLFEAFWAHPFLRGLHDGSAPAETVIHYIGQDHQYLTAFARCYGLGIAKSPDREWITWFTEQIRFLMEDEGHAHHALCKAVGITYDDAQQEMLAPSAQAYVDHMMRCAHDTLGVLLSALLPCAWTYTWAGQRAMTEAPVAGDNPFRGWWEFYGNPEFSQIVTDLRDRIDRLAAEAGSAERARMADAFTRGCQHEVRFWHMAWTLESWTPPPR